MAGPRLHIVGSNGSDLRRHFKAVVEAGRKLPGQSRSDRGLVNVPETAGLERQPLRLPPEQIGLDDRFGNEGGSRPVEAVQPVAVSALVEGVRLNRDDRRRERVELERLARDRRANSVEGARVVDPVQVPDETLLAESQLLAPGADGVPRAAELAVRHAQIDRVAERHGGSARALVEHPCVLDLHHELRRLGGGYGRVDAEAIEHVPVAVVGLERAAAESFEPPAELTPDLQPVSELPGQSDRRRSRGTRRRCGDLPAGLRCSGGRRCGRLRGEIRPER